MIIHKLKWFGFSLSFIICTVSIFGYVLRNMKYQNVSHKWAFYPLCMSGLIVNLETQFLNLLYHFLLTLSFLSTHDHIKKAVILLYNIFNNHVKGILNNIKNKQLFLLLSKYITEFRMSSHRAD